MDQKDLKVMQFAADRELILIDGLETFFAAHSRLHCIDSLFKKRKESR